MFKEDAPLVNLLKEYVKKDPVRFHMPGHKGKFIFSLQKLLSENLYKFDVTEIPGFDNLHQPEGILKQSQRNLASLYGSRRSFYLVNGATSGIIAAMASFLKEKDRVLVPRNSHRSVLNGIILTRSEPVYLIPGVDTELGICLDVPEEKWVSAIEKEKNIKALLVTNPNYNGICPDIEKIIKTARKKNIKTIVDEAHGPHFKFSKKLPPSGVDYKAEITVQSPHKMLLSLTQSAWLHFNGPGKEEEVIRENLSLITSTSPSYILMASLELAVIFLKKFGAKFVDKGVELAELARREINRFTPFYCPGVDYAKSKGFFYDVSRLIINTSSSGYSGLYVEKILRKQYNIFTEYADLNNIYLLITGANSKKDVLNIIKALSTFRKKKGKIFPVGILKKLPERILLPHEVFLRDFEYIPLKNSPGRICRNPVIPYPPGIPVLNPGELITKEHVELLEELVANNYICQGIKNNCIAVVENG